MDIRGLAKRVQAWHVTVAFLAYVLGSVLWFQMGPLADLGETGILDDDGGFTPHEGRAHLDALGPEGVATYETFLAFDFAYALLFVPPVLGVFLIALRRHRWWPTWPVAVPFVAAVLDWLENGLLLSAIHDPSSDATWRAASLASLGKLLLVSASAAVAVLLLVAWGVHLVMNPMKRVRRA